MKNIAIIIILVLCAISCKNQQEKTVEQGIDITENQLDNIGTAVEVEHFNEFENDTTKWVKFESEYNFATFKTKVFRGKLAKIDFTGTEFAKDEDYVDYIISNDSGIDFGGHYTIIRKSCGCMCENLYVIDRISGKILTDINLTTPDDKDGKWGYLYKPDSKLLIANSGLFTTDSLNCYTAVYDGVTPELYFWTGENFKRIQ